MITGSEFEVNITDGSTPNRTLLSRITADYNGKLLQTASRSVLEVSIMSKDGARVPTNIELAIMRDQGMFN